jgi:beta-xylosidase
MELACVNHCIGHYAFEKERKSPFYFSIPDEYYMKKNTHITTKDDWRMHRASGKSRRDAHQFTCQHNEMYLEETYVGL